tara:strand:+ start:3686 stop:4126 length:441 start_codon:yes stop_codon:yes gene_type:complete
MTIKRNPTLSNTTNHFSGKTITAVTLDMAVNGTDFSSTELGPNGAVQQVIAAMSKEATPIVITKLRSDGSNDGQVMDFIYEGEFGTDTYDGTNSETFAAYLQTEIRLLTAAGARSAATIAESGESANVAGLNLSSATVVAATAASF